MKKFIILLSMGVMLMMPAFSLATTIEQTIADIRAQIATLQLQLDALLVQQASSVLQDGSRVEVMVRSLAIRQTPTISGVKVGSVNGGETGVIRCGQTALLCPTTANGYTWWYVAWDNTSTPIGWSAEGTSEVNFLTKVSTTNLPCPSGTVAVGGTCTTPPQPPPSIMVSSPNGGESYKQGDSVTITWSASNLAVNGTNTIELTDVNNNTISTIYTARILNMISYSWNTAGVGVGSYKIRIKSYDPATGVNTSDSSDAPFSIVAPQPIPASVTLHPLIGMEYEPWFPSPAGWGLRWGTPALGLYDSGDPKIIQQHAAWLNAMNVDFILVDWSENTIPQNEAGELPRTDAIFDTYAQMPTHPKIAILLGVHNQAEIDSGALQRQANLIKDRYLNNSARNQSYLRYGGKPLVVVYAQTPAFKQDGLPSWNDPAFTVRWMSGFLESQPNLIQNGQSKYGYWSWIDRDPTPVYVGSSTEAVTVTLASPGTQITYWLSPDAKGRRNGLTFQEQWNKAISFNPSIILIDQWNEFINNSAAFSSGGVGHTDQYTPEFSNDTEPTVELGYAPANIVGRAISAIKGVPYTDLTSATSGGASASSITVLSPNGGETWMRGIPQTITWSSTGNIPTVSIALQDQVGTGEYVIAQNIPNNDSFTFSSFKDISGGSFPDSSYKIKISAVLTANPNTYAIDQSNSPFSIIADNSKLYINPQSIDTNVGKSVQVKASFSPVCPPGTACTQSLQEVNAMWTSANPAVAAVNVVIPSCPVSSPGVPTSCSTSPQVFVAGVAAGATEVKATYTSSSGTVLTAVAKVNVAPAPVLPVPWYRLYKASAIKHFYTTSVSERDAFVKSGYILEGIAGYLYDTQQPGTSPFYRSYNQNISDYLYTTSAAERDSAQAVGYSYQGVAGYLYLTQQTNTASLYRTYSSVGGHFYTMSTAEKDAVVQKLGFTFEAAVGYMFSP